MTDSEETLSTRADALEAIPLHSTDLLTLLDQEGVVRYESPSIERLYGFDQDELVGEQVAEYFHPDDRRRVLAAFQTVVETDDADHAEVVEYRHRMADGSYRWIESVASADPTPKGNYVVNSRDISARKQRERELDAARARAQSERDSKEAVRHLLLEASTGEEIADSVCRLLVDSYRCAAAWVVRHGHESPEDRQTHQRIAEYGDDSGFRAAVESAPDPPTERALATDASVTVTTDDDEGLAEALATCGLRSVQSVPLVHDGISYGALTVVRPSRGSAVSQQLVDEVAAALAFEQRVTRRQEALTSETVTRLDVRVTDGHALGDLTARAPDIELRAEALRMDDGGTYLVRSDDTTAERLCGAARESPSVAAADPTTEADTPAVVRLDADHPGVGEVLRGYGAAVQSITAEGGQVDVTVSLPRRTDVGTVVDTLREQWPEATLRSRREHTVEDDRPTVFDGLTEKQTDALRAATLAGFFQRPQQASAADVAETLGVTQSTFLHHLRNAEQKVFSAAFSSHSTDI